MLAACGTGKPVPDTAGAADSVQRIQAPPPDRIGAAPTAAEVAKSVDSAANVRTDTTEPVAPVKKGDDRLRDSAFAPKFTVDSNGKVTPIKRPTRKPD